MKILLMLIFTIFIVSCGKPPTSNPSTQDSLLIIGGQSNAQGLLQANVRMERTGDVANYPSPNNNVLGYAVGGTSIQYWLVGENSKPLFDIIQANCSSNNTFFWWQGESDAYSQDSGLYEGSYTEFQTRTTEFLAQVHSLCPQINIKIGQIRINTTNPLTNVLSVRDTQVGLGYVLYNSDSLASSDDTNTHLTYDSYLIYLNMLKN